MNSLLKAFNFATFAHKGQTRKGKPEIPYITHPLSVGLLLSQTGADEKLIKALEKADSSLPLLPNLKETLAELQSLWKK